MKKILLIVLFCLSCNAVDKNRGKDIFQVCAACHGSVGISSDGTYPNLAGQKQQYLRKQLHDFKSGTRKDSTMQSYANMLSDQDIDDVSAYISNLQSK